MKTLDIKRNKYIKIRLNETMKEIMRLLGVTFCMCAILFCLGFCAISWPKEFMVVGPSVLGGLCLLCLLSRFIDFCIAAPLVAGVNTFVFLWMLQHILSKIGYIKAYILTLGYIYV